MGARGRKSGVNAMGSVQREVETNAEVPACAKCNPGDASRVTKPKDPKTLAFAKNNFLNI